MFAPAMTAKDRSSQRADTDASLRVERHNTDHELARRVLVADEDADAVLRVARECADRLLQAARAATDARLPLSQQTEAAVALLLEQRDDEDRLIGVERERADAQLNNERQARSEKLMAQLVLERQTTDLRLALERSFADRAVTSRDDFLARATHDLRGLMAAQKLYISALVKDLSSNDGSERLATIAAALTKIETQMDGLLNDLVDTVAMDAGKLALSIRRHLATELLSTAVSVYAPLAKQRDQLLSNVPGAPDVSIAVDLKRGVQVLGNLLSNAIKFTPRGGTIRAGFEASEDKVVFFVEDDGPGVPPEQVPHIFERFVGSNSASSGLGLGLFIAARVVEAHGGRLWLDRDCSSGCRFRFTLRRA